MIRIVGIGSPFGDDRAGWRVAELLKKAPELQIYLNQGLDIQTSDRPGLALIMTMDGINSLYLIDALKAQDNEPGQICRIDHKNLIKENFYSTHGFGVSAALELAQVLGKVPAETIIYGIKISIIDYQASLSPLIAKSCGELAQQIIQELLIKLTFETTDA